MHLLAIISQEPFSRSCAYLTKRIVAVVHLFSWLYFAYFFIAGAFFYYLEVLVRAFTFPFDKNRKYIHYISCLWAYHYIAINPFWRCHWEGREHLKDIKNCIYVGNHQSTADICVVYGLFKPFKWISKSEVLKIPFFGWNMGLNEYVCVQRGDKKSIKETMEKSRMWLSRGVPMFIFPEGTRSEDGEILPFRDGAFRLACEFNIPIAPMVIDGAKDIISKRGKTVNFNVDINVRILPPVYPADFENKPGALREHVFQLMKSNLAEIREGKKKAAKDLVKA